MPLNVRHKNGHTSSNNTLCNQKTLRKKKLILSNQPIALDSSIKYYSVTVFLFSSERKKKHRSSRSIQTGYNTCRYYTNKPTEQQNVYYNY